MKEKIAVAISGGVDSSTIAGRLIQEGYEVVGITLKLWVEGLDENGDTPATRDARAVCEFYGIPHVIIDARDTFKDSVVDYFLEEYKVGRTPNPCVFCNKNIKFKLMLDKALELGCSKLVTGHYAQVKYNEELDEYELHRGIDPQKDQSYVLYTVSQHVLSHVLFPLGNQSKTKTREEAHQMELPTADKPDSLDICFIPNNDTQAFLDGQAKTAVRQGNIVHENGTILGTHEGIQHYTIGQRKGLGVAYEYPLYVIRLDADTNTVVVGPNDSLYQHTMICKHYNFISGKIPTEVITVKGKIRYASEPAACTVEVLSDETMKVTFVEAQRAITPGQSVVFFDGTKVLGGGIIEHTI